MTRRRRRILLPIAIICLFLSAIPITSIARCAGRVQQDLIDLQSLAGQGALALLSPNAVDAAAPLLTRSINDLAELRTWLGPFPYLLPALSWVPRYGGDFANAPALLDLGENVLVAARDTLDVGRALNDEIERGRADAAPVTTSLLRVSLDQRPKIEKANHGLDAVVSARNRVDPLSLSPAPARVLLMIDRVLTMWQAGISLLANAPHLLGSDRPRAYLLVAQNSDELRATGGFVTGVALVRIEQGRISLGEFEDSYDVDNWNWTHPAPPLPLQKYMSAPWWVFRDANWSPDFPTSARDMEKIFESDRGIAVDGVLALNQKIIPPLLTALGPVRLDAYNETVDSSNVVEKIQAYWASPQGLSSSDAWWAHRKDFIGALFQSLVKQVSSGDVARSPLFSALYDAIVSKDLLIFIDDIDATGDGSILRTGALDQGPGDSVMLVDSNVGYNKVDGNVSRVIDHTVYLDDATNLLASTIITYTNYSGTTGAFCVHQPLYLTSYADLQQGCYWNYVRVYVPAGSELLRAGGLTDVTVAVENGRTVFGGYLIVDRGEQRSIRFEYRLPPILLEGRDYTLRLEKQPGAGELDVSLTLVLPAGRRISSAAPPVEHQSENVARLAVQVNQDRIAKVKIGDSGMSPAIATTIGIGILFIGAILLSLGARVAVRKP